MPDNKTRTARVPVKEAILFVAVLLALVFVGWSFYGSSNEKSAITDFASCKAAGYPIAESYPEQCHAEGRSFVNPDQQAGE